MTARQLAGLGLGPNAIGARLAAGRLRRSPQEPFDVATARRTRHGPEGIVLHRVRRPPEATRLKRIPVTTVPPTLLDLAATVPARELERVVREVYATRAAPRDEVESFAEAAAGRAGAPALRCALGAEPGNP